MGSLARRTTSTLLFPFLFLLATTTTAAWNPVRHSPLRRTPSLPVSVVMGSPSSVPLLPNEQNAATSRHFATSRSPRRFIADVVVSNSKNNNYKSIDPDISELEIEIDEDEHEDEDGADTNRKILDLAVPALISLSIDPLMTIADTAFIGRYSLPNDPAPLAGLGSAAALLVFAFYVFNFLATATAPLVAKRRGLGDEAGAAFVGGQALSLAVVLGSVLAAALLLYKAPLLQVMGTGATGPRADRYAEEFLTARALAAPAVLVCSASNGILRGYLDAKTPTLVLLGSNAVNLLLDVVLVARLGMGPLGAGIATTTAEWIAALVFLGVLGGRLPSADGEIGLNSVKRGIIGTDGMGGADEAILTVTPVLELPKWTDIRPLVVASSAVFLRTVVLQVAMSSAAAMAARASGSDMISSAGASSSVAAHQIALQLWLLCSFLCDALATASQALVADGIGRGDSDSVRGVSKTVFQWGVGLGLTLSSILWVGTYSGFLTDFFTSDEGTRIELGKLLAIVILAQPLNAFVFAADGVLQGAEEFAYQAKSMALSVVTAFAVFLILQYTTIGRDVILGGDVDTLVNVWYGLIALQSMRGLTSLVKLMEEKGPIDLLGKQLA
ncbi:hypothetical protein ACHAXS_005424 [Conticribra weissflogii]